MNRKIANFSEVFSRGVLDVIPRKDVEALFRSGKKLRIKHGVDPTTPDLHLGYAVIYEKLRVFQDLGHTIVFLIGDFTGRFGDPSDRERARGLRARKEVKRITKGYLAQLGKILDLSRTEIRYNSEWYDRMKAEEFLGLVSHFTLQRMLERDMFEKRIREGKEVFLHEPLYPVLQAYDSVMIRSHLTVIGSDQLFNELQARKLQEDFGQLPQGIIAMKILVGLDGKQKMSQSLGNYIGISEPAEVQFGKLMSIPDSVIPHYAELLTNLPLEYVRQMESRVQGKGIGLRDLKIRVAEEIVSRFHGKKAALTAAREFAKVFSRREFPTSLPTKKLSKKDWLPVELLVRLGLVSSKSEARRLIKEGAVEFLEGGKATPITSWENSVLLRDGMVVRVGKRRFIQVQID